MDEKDWDAIIKIIKHLEEGMNNVRMGYHPVVAIQEAVAVAEERKKRIANKKG